MGCPSRGYNHTVPLMGSEPRNISTGYKPCIITDIPGLGSAAFILHFETVTAVMTVICFHRLLLTAWTEPDEVMRFRTPASGLDSQLLHPDRSARVARSETTAAFQNRDVGLTFLQLQVFSDVTPCSAASVFRVELRL